MEGARTVVYCFRLSTRRKQLNEHWQGGRKWNVERGIVTRAPSILFSCTTKNNSWGVQSCKFEMWSSIAIIFKLQLTGTFWELYIKTHTYSQTLFSNVSTFITELQVWKNGDFRSSILIVREI